MSRFSKAAAEALGWSFYHDSPEVVLNDGNNQSGVSKKVPASVRAEKFLSLPGQAAKRITEEAETIGKLLERINAFEQHLSSRGLNPQGASEEPKPSQVVAPSQPSPQDFGDGSPQVFESEKSASSVDLESLTVAELKELAEKAGVEISGIRKKDGIISKLIKVVK